MTGATLWLEITIGGAVFVLAQILLVCAVLGLPVPRVTAEDIKEYLPYAAATFVAASFVSGIVMHRVVQKLGGEYPNRQTQRAIFRNLVDVWMKDAPRVHREMDFQYSLVALLDSLRWSMPMLAVGMAAWLWRLGAAWKLDILPLCLLAYWGLVLFVFPRQREQNKALHEVVFRAADAATLFE